MHPQPTVFQELLHFYKRSSLDSNSDYKQIAPNAEKFLEGKTTEDKEQLLTIDCSIIEVDLFNQDFELLLGFENFLVAIKNSIDGYVPKFRNFNGLRRLMCPPLEVFQYKGFSELNIRQSKDSYALLFE